MRGARTIFYILQFISNYNIKTLIIHSNNRKSGIINSKILCFQNISIITISSIYLLSCNKNIFIKYADYQKSIN